MLYTRGGGINIMKTITAVNDLEVWTKI